MSIKLWQHRISDIIAAIEKIQNYVEKMDLETFQQDSKTSDAVIRNFIIIGEAARNVPEKITKHFPAIPWRLMGDMRNFAVHEYWGVELRTVWETIQQDLPPLIPLLEEVLKQEDAIKS